MKNFLENLFFSAFLKLTKFLPDKLVVSIGKHLGLLLHFSRLRRSVVMKNLEIAFGSEKSLQERQLICRKNFEHLGTLLMEFLLLDSMSEKKLKEYVKIENLDLLKDACKENRGVVFAGAHFGNWEFMPPIISVNMNETIHVYTGKQRNPAFDSRINQIRQSFGNKTISKSKRSPREMMRVLKDKELLGIVGDLNVPHDDLFVNFFGKQAALGQGLATFALRFKAPLIFTWGVREETLKHRIRMIRINYEEKLTGNSEEDVKMVGQMIIDQLEKVIRRNPEQYFWVNKRWKTRPPGEKHEDVY